MFRKDYILRMVEMLGELIASILGLIKKGNYNQASQALDNAYFDFLKEDAALLRSIPKENITEKLMLEHNYTHNHLEILAELFSTEAELQYAQNKPIACLEFSEKALLLYEFLDKETKLYSLERSVKMNTLKNRIMEIITKR
jgi:hypothetical protein